MNTRPVWVEISGRNLVANFCALKAIADRHRSNARPTQLLAVVKANAYGHGVLDCAPLLVEAGAEWLGVTSVEEGVRVRHACPGARILVMSGIWQGEAEALLEHRLTPVIWEHYHLDLIEAAARKLRVSPYSIPVHLEIDTGMSRQGLRAVEASGQVSAEFTAMAARFPPGPPFLHPFPLGPGGAGFSDSPQSFWLEALTTHFSSPEAIDYPVTGEQLMRFELSRAQIASRGPNPRWLSAGNSATLLLGRDIDPLIGMSKGVGAALILRPGLSLYGYTPRFTGGRLPADVALPELQPVLTWKTRITSLRTILPGDSAGYNATFRATRPTRLALLPLGYADGLNRLLSNCGEVLIRGQRAPIAGRVSMDQTIIDVTGIPGADIGDEAVLIGTQNGESITAYDIADLTGTIPYEVLCGINARVPRILVD